jgi:DNA replication protein DnaC
MKTAEEIAPELLARFAEMIAAAPEESEMIAEYHTSPCLVKLAHGWGQKYVDEAELHGDQWLEAFKQAKNIIAARGIVALLGTRGTGKTRMAAEITRSGYFPTDHGEWNGNGVVHGKTSKYIRTLDVFLNLRDAANSKTSSEKQVLADLEKPGLLVMDEFHERGGSEWENRIVANLIDKRYSQGRPSILIANYTVQEMAAAIGPSVADRMRENGKAFICDWPSYRGGIKQ